MKLINQSYISFKVVGIMGMGEIGLSLATTLKNFGIKTIYGMRNRPSLDDTSHIFDKGKIILLRRHYMTYDSIWCTSNERIPGKFGLYCCHFAGNSSNQWNIVQ
jgi:hypothetical protein